jgi:hypothetical protein
MGEEVEVRVTESKFNSSLDVTNFKQSSKNAMYEELVLMLISANAYIS